MPMISTVSPTFTIPRSTRPVTTVPRPEIENTSSIGIRKGWSIGRSGCGIYSSTFAISSRIASWPSLGSLSFQRHQGRAAHDRNVVARELVAGQKLAHFHLHQIQKLRIIDHVALVHEHHQAGTPTWRARRMCSRVCGIGPSDADTTRIAPSIWAAPVIMFFT